MPLIYRVMARDGEYPMVGDTSNRLGVRPEVDIPVDHQGEVAPQTGGMSVAPEWRVLPFFLIPKRLRSLVPAAHGSNMNHCWKMGARPFTLGVVGKGLVLRPDRATHGVVEPAESMSLADFQAALAGTREQWTDGEPRMSVEQKQ